MACIVAIVYTYAGYPLLLAVGAWLRPTPPSPPRHFPRATVLVAAHDEEASIEQCIRAVLSSEYPSGLLDMIVVSDASTDRTNGIVSCIEDARLRLVPLAPRQGKDAALMAVRDAAAGAILILMDASTVVERTTLARLVRHFHDPRVGAVSGRKTVHGDRSSVARSDGMYWDYDSALRSMESRTGSSGVGVEGGLFAIRKEYFTLQHGRGAAADLSLGFRVAAAGLRNLYEPAAVFRESASRDMGTEFKRKIRVIVRGMRAFFLHWRLLNPIARPGLVFQVVSHKLLRWLVPFFLLGLFGCCLLSTVSVLRVMLVAQVGFYAAAVSGLVLGTRAAGVPVVTIPAYFCAMNGAALISWFLLSRRFDIWAPTRRIIRPCG